MRRARRCRGRASAPPACPSAGPRGRQKLDARAAAPGHRFAQAAHTLWSSTVTMSFFASAAAAASPRRAASPSRGRSPESRCLPSRAARAPRAPRHGDAGGDDRDRVRRTSAAVLEPPTGNARRWRRAPWSWAARCGCRRCRACSPPPRPALGADGVARVEHRRAGEGAHHRQVLEGHLRRAVLADRDARRGCRTASGAAASSSPPCG